MIMSIGGFVAYTIKLEHQMLVDLVMRPLNYLEKDLI